MFPTTSPPPSVLVAHPSSPLHSPPNTSFPSLPSPCHSQSVQRDELEWRLGQERGVELQSQTYGGGQAQSRGAMGLTVYHRPLALRIEVSASSLLHLPFNTGMGPLPKSKTWIWTGMVFSFHWPFYQNIRPKMWFR